MATNSGQFPRGHVPWNKGLKGWFAEGTQATRFRKGENIRSDHPSWKGGVQTPKNDCIHVSIGCNKRVRRPRKVYEENFGKPPKGYVIWHIDGDKTNDAPENLEAISRATAMRRNANNHEE